MFPPGNCLNNFEKEEKISKLIWIYKLQCHKLKTNKSKLTNRRNNKNICGLNGYPGDLLLST
jgi:hypothetical protein